MKKSAAPFWKKTEVIVAVISGCALIVGAVVTGIFTLSKKEPPPPPPHQEATATNTNINQIQLPPPQAPAAKGSSKLVLEQFTINKSDSFYEECSDSTTDCTTPSWKGDFTHWQPTDEWRNAVSVAGVDPALLGKDPAEDEYTRAFENKYLANQKYFKDRLSPVFDVVVSNPGHDVAVLTDIDAVIFHSEPYAQGDAEGSGSSGVIPVLNRYSVALSYLSGKGLPHTITQAATPPLSVAPNHPARFQVSFDCKTGGAEWIFELRLRLHFGPRVIVETKRFRLTC